MTRIHTLPRTLATAFLIWALIPLLPALAGSATSGGGGAYVCTDSAGNITSSHLVDLWESEHSPFQWKGQQATTIHVGYDDVKPAQQQLTEALAKLSSLEPNLGSRVSLALRQIQASVSSLPSGVSLTIPNDLQVDYFPTSCPPEGMLRYNGVTQTLEVKTSIFDKLATQTDIAAAYLHESIYKVFRDGPDQAVNSVLARRLVACLFSQDCLTNATLAIPTGKTAFSCTSSLMDATVYAVDSGQWRFVMTRLGDTKYGAEISQDLIRYDQRAILFDGIWTGGWFSKFGYYPIASQLLVGPPSYPLDAHSIAERGLAAEFSNILLRYDSIIDPSSVKLSCSLLH